MCCRTRLQGIDNPEIIDAMMTIGRFEREGSNWVRRFGDAKVIAHFNTDGDLEINLSPPVATNIEAHFGKREAAGAMYELAARIGEKTGAGIIQAAVNVADCLADGRGRDRVLALPGQRLDFSALCSGFQAVFLGETAEH